MLIVDPLQYFSDCVLRESRVIGFAFNGRKRQLRLDIDYAAEVVSHWFEAKRAGIGFAEYQPLPTDFRRFTFFDVSASNLGARHTPSQKQTPSNWVDLLDLDNPRLPVIEDFVVRRIQNNLSARLECYQIEHHLFEFTFVSIDEQRRRGCSLHSEGNEPLFQDVDDKTTFDFYHPFPRDD